MLINGLGMLVKCNPAYWAPLYLSGFSLLLVNTRELLRDPTQAWTLYIKMILSCTVSTNLNNNYEL